MTIYSVTNQYLLYFRRKIMEYFINFGNKDIPNIKIRSIVKKYSNQDTIFILGNGPSLKKFDLNQLKNQITICCNGFCKIHNKINWQPTFYVFEDVNSIQKNLDFINSSDRESCILLPYRFKKLISTFKNIFYLNFRFFYLNKRHKRWPLFSSDISQVSYWGNNVIYLSLQLAASLKPKKIILLGVDLNWRYSKKNGKVYNLKSNHFTENYHPKDKTIQIADTSTMVRALKVAFLYLKEMKIDLFTNSSSKNLNFISKLSDKDILNIIKSCQ